MDSSTVKYVDHTYRDFSQFIEQGGELIKHKKSDANFPAKLHKMISEPSHSHAITWMPHGRAWKILDKDILFTSIIPKYYVCKKYESFTRQLNGWGFKRLYQSGPDLGCFYHECFLRGLSRLTCLIRRLPSNQGKTTPYPAGEPNFYRITEAYPLPDSEPSDASAKSPAAEEGEATTLVLDTPGKAPSDDPSHNDNQYPPLPSLPRIHPLTQEPSTAQQSAATALVPHQGQLQEPTPRQSMAVFVAAASSAVPPREHSIEVQHPPFSTPRPLTHECSEGFAAGLAAAAAATPNVPSRPMPQYAPNYYYQPSSDHRSYLHPRSYLTNYPLTLGDFGQPHDSGYAPYSTQDWPPQYQYQPSEPPRFRYPPPELPRYQYPPPPNYHYPYANPISDFLPLLGYPHAQESNLNPGPVALPPSGSHASHDRNDKPLDQSSEKTPESSPIIEPLPYFSPGVGEEIVERDSSERKRKDPPASGEDLDCSSPLQKKMKGEDPP